MNLATVAQYLKPRGRAFVDIALAFFRPRRTLEANGLADFSRNAISVSLWTLVAMSILVSVTAFGNWDAIEVSNRHVAELAAGSSPLFATPSPPFRLMFGIYWFSFVALIAGIRALWLKILGDWAPGFSAFLGCCLFAALPAIVLGGLQAMIANFFPYVPAATDSNIPFVRVYSAVGVTLISFLWEGYLFIAATRHYYSLNRGRAALVWFAPVLTVFILSLLLNTLFLFL